MFAGAGGTDLRCSSGTSSKIAAATPGMVDDAAVRGQHQAPARRVDAGGLPSSGPHEEPPWPRRRHLGAAGPAEDCLLQVHMPLRSRQAVVTDAPAHAGRAHQPPSLYPTQCSGGEMARYRCFPHPVSPGRQVGMSGTRLEIGKSCQTDAGLSPDGTSSGSCYAGFGSVSNPGGVGDGVPRRAAARDLATSHPALTQSPKDTPPIPPPGHL